MRGRWLILWLGILAWFVAASLWIGSDPRIATTAYEVFSTYNTSPGGLSQAFAYLRDRRGPASVQRLTARVLPGKATVIRVVEADKQTESFFDVNEDEWLRSGGRLIVIFSNSYRGIFTKLIDCDSFEQVFPTLPALPALEPYPCRTLEGGPLQNFHSVLLTGGLPAIARTKVGRGEVVLFSMPEALSNDSLGDAGHLDLLEWLAGAGPVYFDESIHGIFAEESIADLLIREWRLGPAIVLLFLAALLHFWRRAKRIGPADRAERDVRSEAIDLVESMGQLYDRSIDREQALRLYYHALVRAVHARTGLRGEALERAVRDRTHGYDPTPRHDLSREEFQRLLRILNHAHEMVGYAHTR